MGSAVPLWEERKTQGLGAEAREVRRVRTERGAPSRAVQAPCQLWKWEPPYACALSTWPLASSPERRGSFMWRDKGGDASRGTPKEDAEEARMPGQRVEPPPRKCWRSWWREAMGSGQPPAHERRLSSHRQRGPADCPIRRHCALAAENTVARARVKWVSGLHGAMSPKCPQDNCKTKEIPWYLAGWGNHTWGRGGHVWMVPSLEPDMGPPIDTGPDNTSP